MEPITAVTDPGTTLWWQRGVIYQIYPRSFRDTNDDGVGDLPGILEKIDYLSEVLKIDAVWLSPFYPSPMADFGYDVSDYTDVNPLFGTLADFDALVEASHARGMRIIVDFVPNHTSDQHPWFIESRSSRDNPKRDWYVWKDAKPDGSPPNNWVSEFGGGAWEWDPATEQYYLHKFVKQQPDLNWRNPEVKRAMLDVLRFWLDRGVDGFRIDVAHFIMKDPEFRDNPPNPAIDPSGAPVRESEQQLHIHDFGHPDVHGVFREIRALLDSYSATEPRMAVGEIYESDWEKWASYYGESLDELHMPFNFAMLLTPWTASAVRGVVETVEAVTARGAWPNYVLGNHDRERLASRVGPDQARVALMLLLTLRGTPTLYYGEEIGMHNVAIPPEKVQDPWEMGEPGMGLGRDPVRTPMQWDTSRLAGFTGATEAWLPVADDYALLNVATEIDDPASTLTMVRRSLALRREAPALHSGSYRTIESGDPDVYAFIRQYEDERFLIAANFSDERKTLDLALPGRGRTRASTHGREDEVDLRAFPLLPHEARTVEILG